MRPLTKETNAIPAEAGRVLRPVLPALAGEIIEAIGREVPPYARPLEGTFGRNLRAGVEVALGRFVDLLEQPGGDARAGRETYVALGRGEWRDGRTLDVLLAAYRVGARVAWRRIAQTGEAGGLEPAVLFRLGEAIFAYIDELSAESVEGYAAEQAAGAVALERQRHALALLLAQDPPAEEGAIRGAARDARWPLPGSLAALVVSASDPDRLAGRLGQGMLTLDDPESELYTAFLPDVEAPGRRREIERAVEGQIAALGPALEWPLASRSLRRALDTHRLLASGSLAADRLAIADDHLALLLLHADPALRADLADRALAPLDDLGPATRARLETTLSAWLDRPGQPQAVGRALHVHAQTVRYRMRALRELFGDRLDDPDARFELALALRCRV